MSFCPLTLLHVCVQVIVIEICRPMELPPGGVTAELCSWNLNFMANPPWDSHDYAGWFWADCSHVWLIRACLAYIVMAWTKHTKPKKHEIATPNWSKIWGYDSWNKTVARFSRGSCQAALHRAELSVELNGLVAKISVPWWKVVVKIWDIWVLISFDTLFKLLCVKLLVHYEMLWVWCFPSHGVWSRISTVWLTCDKIALSYNFFLGGTAATLEWWNPPGRLQPATGILSE